MKPVRATHFFMLLPTNNRVRAWHNLNATGAGNAAEALGRS